MKNSVLCKNCSTENPVYSHICSNCKQFLRDKVSNIDIWKTIVNLIESPSKAFYTIIYSEHKNFIAFLLIILGFRIMILARYVSLPFSDTIKSIIPFGFAYILVLISLVILFCLVSFVLTMLLNRLNYSIRFKDTLSLNVYAQLPHIFAVLILFPVELIVFGNSLFLNNPYPFQIKPFVAYILIGFEAGMMLWVIVLNYIAYRVQTGDRKLSLILTFFTFSMLTGLIFTLSSIVF